MNRVATYIAAAIALSLPALSQPGSQPAQQIGTVSNLPPDPGRCTDIVNVGSIFIQAQDTTLAPTNYSGPFICLETGSPRNQGTGAFSWQKILFGSGGGGGGVSGSGTLNFVTKWTGTTSIGNSSMFDDGTNPTQIPDGASVMINGGFFYQMTNSASPGTGANLVACQAASSTAATCATSNPTGILGIAGQGAGTSGLVQLCFEGRCSALFDNQSTAGDWAILSTTVAGELHDTGSTTKTANAYNFLVDSANSGPGTLANVKVLTPDQIGGAISVAGCSSTNPGLVPPTGGGTTAFLRADCTFATPPGTGTVTSVTFTGDGTVLSSTPSSAVTTSGTLTATLATAGAHDVLANFTGSTATPTYGRLTTAELPFTYSGSTLELATFIGAATNGNCVQIDASGNLVSAGAPCGSGGGATTFQVDGTNLTSQAIVNFQDSNSFNGLTATFSNPSAGNVKLGFTGTLGNGGLTNTATTVNGQTCTLGSTCNVNNGDATHSVALNEGNGAALGAATIGTSGRLLIDQGASADPAFKVVSGDGTITNLGVLTITAINGTAFPTSATVIGSNSSAQPIAAALANGKVWLGNGSNLPVATATPTLGVAGSLVGSIGFNNATSGSITLQPTTGALSSTTITIPANAQTMVVAPTSTTTTQALFATATAGAPAFRAISGSDIPTSNQYKSCNIIIGADNGSILVTADIQPQKSQCVIEAAWTAYLVIVYVDSGSSTVQLGYRHNGSTTAISPVLTPATVAGITDNVACANVGGTAVTLEGHSVTCSTLSNTSLSQYDEIETIGGAADGTTKRVSAIIISKIN